MMVILASWSNSARGTRPTIDSFPPLGLCLPQQGLELRDAGTAICAGLGPLTHFFNRAKTLLGYRIDDRVPAHAETCPDN